MEAARVPKRRTCGTMDQHRRLLKTDPRYRRNRLEIEKFTQAYTERTAGQGLRAGIVIIPVVVHVLWNTAAQNISAAQINSQIAILNRDYRKLNADIGSVPGAFAPLAADARIEFRLAQRDPSCNPFTGITRTSTTVTTFHEPTNDIKSAATGGHDAWPRDKYLNIWVGPRILDALGHDLLGYAQFPGGPAATDGVVILHSGFGDTGTAAAPYNLGRTATHEIGHWLNLLHIWGDDGGGCGGSDQVADTPNQADLHFGCPPFPTVSCSNGPNGDMFMNYMDYTDDRCMFMFTGGQSTRMDATLYGSRSAIVGSSGHLPPTSPAAPDLWSEDRPDDTGAEPDPAPGPMWESDDIWVRRQNDGLTQQEHQNPEYRTAGGAPNYVYVRVRNRGCNAAPSATVKLYWAKASTALAWPAPWDGSVTLPALMGSPIGTKATGSVTGASFTILEFPWNPPNPADYASFGADQSHFCLLSRIETSPTAPFGMTTPEGSDLNANVRDNNNIVWKNITVVDEVPGTGRVGFVTVGSLDEQSEARLVFTVPRERIKAKNQRTVFDWGSVDADLGAELFERWREGGAQGDGIEVVDGTAVRVLKAGAWIGGLPFTPGDLYTVSLRFESRQEIEGNAIYFVDLTQYAVEGERQRIVGGQQFVVKTLARKGRDISIDDILTFDGAEWTPAPERVVTPL